MGIVLNKKKHFFLNKMGRVRTKTLKSYHREVLRKAYQGLPLQQENHRRCYRHSIQENEKQDCWFRHPLDEENRKRTSQRYLPQASRRGKRKKDGFHPRKVRDPNRQHRMERPSCQVTHQRARHQATRQPTQTTKTTKKPKLIFGRLWSLIIVNLV